MIIKEIEELGRKVDSLWKEKGKDPAAFSKIAAAVLQESQLHNHFIFEKFLSELWALKELPQQLDPQNNFGHPPITLYRADDFVIDIYFWITPDIKIHSHCFQGAFTVLQGLSLECQYQFDVQEDLDDQILIGDLRLKNTKLVRPGEVEEILKGTGFIHQVWHLGCPTVSLAVRTPGKEKIPTQRFYLNPHLAFYQHRPLSPTLQKQVDTLLMLRRIHQPEEPHLLQLASSLEPGLAFKLLFSYYTAVGDFALIEKITAQLPKLSKWAALFLASLRQHYETAFDMAEIPDLDERFLLAMLRISSTREQSERLFKSVFPHQNFLEAVPRLFRSLLEKKSLRFEFNQTAQDISIYLFQGYNESQILEKLSENYEVENNEDLRSSIRQFSNQLTSCDLLKPLLPQRSLSISWTSQALVAPQPTAL